MRVNYAIVFVSDMPRSVSFYRDVVGLPLKFETPQWSEFATDGATLALHLDATAGRCRPGLGVPNLAEFHARVVQHGCRCIQEPKEVFGAKVAQYADPDGLTISVAEQAPAAGTPAAAAPPPAAKPPSPKATAAAPPAKAPKTTKPGKKR